MSGKYVFIDAQLASELANDADVGLGDALVATKRTAVGAAARTVHAYIEGTVYQVDDFDGATDTAKFQAAISTATVGTTPSHIVGTPGRTYTVSNLSITSANGVNNSIGEKSITIWLYGCVLKGDAAASHILSVGTAGTPATSWCNGVQVCGGTFDMSLMPNAASSYGLYLTNAYNCSFRDISFYGAPSSAIDIFIQDRAYTLTFEAIFAGKVNIAGYNVATDAITSLVFINPVVNTVTIDKAWNINFLNAVVQSAAGSKVVMSNCFKINFFGGDIEGAAGTAFDFSGGGVEGFYERGMNISSTLAYCTGTAPGSYFGSLRKYNYGNVYGSASQNIPTTGATTIWTFTGDPTSGGLPTTMAKFTIAGDDGTRGWEDELVVVHGATYARRSSNTYGAGQPTRTYSLSGINLQVALSAAVANNVRQALVSNAV